VPLVRRGHRFQGLTAEGERALEWAHRILADADGMRADLAALRDGAGGRLRLGAIPTSLPLIARLTGPLRARHPALHVAIRSLSSREIERGLREGELDAGLTYLDNEPLQGVRRQPLYDERYVLAAPAGGRWARGGSVRWREAAAAPLCLLSPDMQHRRIVDALFARAGATPDPLVETNSISTLHAQVRDGGLCAVMAETWLDAYGSPEGIAVRPLADPSARQAVGVVWRDRDPEPALVRALVAVAREARAALATA